MYEDGTFYIGQYQNNLPNGKGTFYYPNGNICYEGDFFNGFREGFGKYNYQDGSFYIGQWKNNLRNGKGTFYYPNGTIFYDGFFINDLFAGN